MLSLVAFAPEDAWAACKNAGTSYQGTKLSSEIRKNTVTVCAAAVKVVPARTSVVKKIIIKPAAVKTKVVKLRKSGIVIKVKPKAKKTTKKTKKKVVKKSKKVIKKKTTKKKSKKKSSDLAKFKPKAVQASVSPGTTLDVGQSASFRSNSATHFKNAVILNLTAQVRFVPVKETWSFGDGATSSGASASHSYSAAGGKSVKLTVTYSVSYRAKGSGRWISAKGNVAVTDTLSVQVTGGDIEPPPATPSPEPSSGQVLLVGSDCILRPSSFGCG